MFNTQTFSHYFGRFYFNELYYYIIFSQWEVWDHLQVELYGSEMVSFFIKSVFAHEKLNTKEDRVKTMFLSLKRTCPALKLKLTEPGDVSIGAAVCCVCYNDRTRTQRFLWWARFQTVSKNELHTRVSSTLCHWNWTNAVKFHTSGDVRTLFFYPELNQMMSVLPCW